VIRIPSIVDVQAPAEDVFTYLSDPATNPDWSPNALELIEPPDGPLALGTRYRVRLRLFGPVSFLIDEFEPGRRFRVACDPPGGRLTHRFIIDAIPAGARINHLVEFEPHGLAILAQPILRFLQKRMVADLNNQLARVVPAAVKRQTTPGLVRTS
jgi:Polyketide cyclase / dehydrase and lipid transport